MKCASRCSARFIDSDNMYGDRIGKKYFLMTLYIRLGRTYCFEDPMRNEMTTTPEGRVSAALRQAVINCGGEIRKVQWQGRVGAPDWLVMLCGSAIFVETKAPGEVPRRSQIVEFRRISRASGIPVLVMDRAEDADVVIDALLSRHEGNHEAYRLIIEKFSFERLLEAKPCG